VTKKVTKKVTVSAAQVAGLLSLHAAGAADSNRPSHIEPKVTKSDQKVTEKVTKKVTVSAAQVAGLHSLHAAGATESNRPSQSDQK
jgi:hypothetical protein